MKEHTRQRMEVVAEGAENVEQLEKLKSALCDCAQGYLLSKPLFPDAVSGVLCTNLLARLDEGSFVATGG